MKAPELTDELKNDLKALKMRASMDPKRFYKKNDRDGFPKYFQVWSKENNGSRVRGFGWEALWWRVYRNWMVTAPAQPRDNGQHPVQTATSLWWLSTWKGGVFQGSLGARSAFSNDGTCKTGVPYVNDISLRAGLLAGWSRNTGLFFLKVLCLKLKGGFQSVCRWKSRCWPSGISQVRFPFGDLSCHFGTTVQSLASKSTLPFASFATWWPVILSLQNIIHLWESLDPLM